MDQELEAIVCFSMLQYNRIDIMIVVKFNADNAIVSNGYGWTIYDDSAVREENKKDWAMSENVAVSIHCTSAVHGNMHHV